jgi:hypothetical protein
LLDALSATDLTFDLLAGPACGVDGSGLEVSIYSSLFDHLSEPIRAVIIREFAMGEGLREITTMVSIIYHQIQLMHSPNDSHRGSHQSIASVLVQEDGVEK